METNSTIQTKGVSLVNVSAVTMSVLDERVLEMINATSVDVALNQCAASAASSGDLFYRMCIHAATAKGLYTLPANEDGKYPSKSQSVSDALNVVSTESTNSQRKYFSEIIRKGWLVAQEGFDPLDFPNVGSLRKAVAPKKSVNIRLEQDSINEDVIAQYNAGKIAEAEAKARALAEKVAAEQEAEAAKAAEVEAEKAKREIQGQVDAIRVDVENLRQALQGALYGTTDQRKALRASYPKV